MKVEEEVECSKIVVQKVTIKEEFVDVQIDVTSNEYIFFMYKRDLQCKS
jgi:hypothetical protein